jgi:hypothetical protein
MKTRWGVQVGTALVMVTAWLWGTGQAGATTAMQKQAKAAGLEVANCLSCHNEKLPKKGAVTQNDRGKFLVAEKEKRKAKEIDVLWLKDYKEPAK